MTVLMPVCVCACVRVSTHWFVGVRMSKSNRMGVGAWNEALDTLHCGGGE